MENLNKMASEPETIALTGVISKCEEQFGMIRDDVFFIRSVVKGPLPKVGDLVLAQVEKVEGMPFKFVAKRVQGLFKSEDSENSDGNTSKIKVESLNPAETNEQENSQQENLEAFELIPTTTLLNSGDQIESLTAVEKSHTVEIECQASASSIIPETPDISIPGISKTCTALQEQKEQSEVDVLQNLKVEVLAETSQDDPNRNWQSFQIDKMTKIGEHQSYLQQNRDRKKSESKQGVSKRPSDFSKRLREKLSRLYCNEDGQEQCFTCGSIEHKVKYCPIRLEKIKKGQQETMTAVVKEEAIEDSFDHRTTISVASSSGVSKREAIVKVEADGMEIINDAVDSEELEDPFLQFTVGSQNENPQEVETVDNASHQPEKTKNFIKVRGQRLLYPPPSPSIQSTPTSSKGTVCCKCQKEEVLSKPDESAEKPIATNSSNKASSVGAKENPNKGKPKIGAKKQQLDPKWPKGHPALQEDLRCPNCKKTGHKVEKCPAPKKPFNKKAKEVMFCQKCRRTNHNTENCRVLKKPKLKKSQKVVFCHNCKRNNHNTEDCRLLKNPAFNKVEEIVFCINCQSATHNTEDCRFLKNPEFKKKKPEVFCVHCQMTNHSSENCRFPSKNQLVPKTKFEIYCNFCKMANHSDKNCRLQINQGLKKKEGPIFCHHCQKKNHRTEDCRSKVELSNNIVFCHYCQKKNHDTKNCRFLKNEPVKNSPENLPCRHCKMKNHKSEDCLFRISGINGVKCLVCFKCQKPGHIGKNCQSKVSASGIQSPMCEGCVIAIQGGNSRNHHKDCLFWENPRFNPKRKHELISKNPFEFGNIKMNDNSCNYQDPPFQGQNSNFQDNGDHYNNNNEHNFEFQGPPNKRNRQMLNQNEETYQNNFDFQGPPMEEQNFDFQGPPMEEPHPMFHHNQNENNYNFEDFNCNGPPIKGRLPIFNPKSNKWSDEVPADTFYESGRTSPVRLVARQKEYIKSARVENKKRIPPRDWQPNFSEPFNASPDYNDCYQESPNFSESFDICQDDYRNSPQPSFRKNFDDRGVKHNQQPGGPPFCFHCNKVGHVDKKCWFLHPSLKRR